MSDPQSGSLQLRIDQQRGSAAWEAIGEVQDTDKDKVKQAYRTQARQLTALVRTNGLAQTLAFLYAKSKPSESTPGDDARACGMILRHVSAAIAPVLGLPPAQQEGDIAKLLRHLLAQSSQTHRRATVEALAFARWLSRFAEAELPSSDAR